jgi:hypothetical protein
VNVAYFYPAPAQPEAPRGGYASRWQLREAAGAWAIESEAVYLYWD